jgi:hypothetical protein
MGPSCMPLAPCMAQPDPGRHGLITAGTRTRARGACARASPQYACWSMPVLYIRKPFSIGHNSIGHITGQTACQMPIKTFSETLIESLFKLLVNRWLQSWLNKWSNCKSYLFTTQMAKP